jgi:hypothetical protein
MRQDPMHLYGRPVRFPRRRGRCGSAIHMPQRVVREKGVDGGPAPAMTVKAGRVGRAGSRRPGMRQKPMHLYGPPARSPHRRGRHGSIIHGSQPAFGEKGVNGRRAPAKTVRMGRTRRAKSGRPEVWQKPMHQNPAPRRAQRALCGEHYPRSGAAAAWAGLGRRGKTPCTRSRP